MNVNPPHRSHDELLIVRVASGDADPVDRAAADRQLESCAECQTLLADVLAIRASTSPDVLRVPPRPRSVRIPAAELERMGDPAWRRWLAGFGTPRFDLVRPLATAVAGLGLVVLVLGSVPISAPSFGFAAAGAPRTPAGPVLAPLPGGDRSNDQVSGSQASPGATSSVAAEGAYGQASGENTGQSPQATSPAALRDGSRDLAGSGAPSVPLAPLGALAVVAGVALVFLNTTARRAAGR